MNLFHPRMHTMAPRWSQRAHLLRCVHCWRSYRFWSLRPLIGQERIAAMSQRNRRKWDAAMAELTRR